MYTHLYYQVEQTPEGLAIHQLQVWSETLPDTDQSTFVIPQFQLSIRIAWVGMNRPKQGSAERVAVAERLAAEILALFTASNPPIQ